MAEIKRNRLQNGDEPGVIVEHIAVCDNCQKEYLLQIDFHQLGGKKKITVFDEAYDNIYKVKDILLCKNCMNTKG